MVRFSHVITDPMGLHARPVAGIVAEVQRWPACRVTVSHAERRVPGDSLMGLLALDARAGDAVVFEVEGPDDRACAEALQALVEA